MATGQNTALGSGYPQTQAQQGSPPSNQDNQEFQSARMTDEEKKVLSECESESLFKRALPLSCGAILGVQYLVRTGKVAGHPKYGAIPKTIIATGLAYIFGKVSYLPECRKKILERIPDSNLAQTIRKRENRSSPDMGKQELFTNQPPAMDGDHSRSNFSSDSSPAYEGLSDSQRPSLDNEIKVKDTPDEKLPLSYGDLRQKNRQEYKDNQSKPVPPSQPGTPSYKDSPYMPQKPWPEKKSPAQEPGEFEQPSSQAPPKRKRTNMWGDVIED